MPADDQPTGSYTLLNLSTSRSLRLGESDALLFAKLNNLGNVLAYNAASVATIRALSPLPGRGLMAGLRVSF